MIQVGITTPHLGASHLSLLPGVVTSVTMSDIPRVDLTTAPTQLATVAELVAAGHVRAAHDCSEGGMLTAAAEMAIAGRLGLDIDLSAVPRRDPVDETAACFAETPSRILLSVTASAFDAVARALTAASVPFGQVGTFTDTGRLTVRSDGAGLIADLTVRQLKDAWQGPLNW